VTSVHIRAESVKCSKISGLHGGEYEDGRLLCCSPCSLVKFSNVSKAANTCETSVDFHQTTWRSSPEDSHLQLKFDFMYSWNRVHFADVNPNKIESHRLPSTIYSHVNRNSLSTLRREICKLIYITQTDFRLFIPARNKDHNITYCEHDQSDNDKRRDVKYKTHKLSSWK
jgi:hypothetical protein